MDRLHTFWKRVVNVLDPAGDWVALLPIRLLLAYEYGKAGMMKLNGNNWFANVQDNFPFPFNVLPPELSWFLASWTEFLGGILLLFNITLVAFVTPFANVGRSAAALATAGATSGGSSPPSGSGSRKVTLALISGLRSSSLSRMVKFRLMPRRSACRRRILFDMWWNVPPHSPATPMNSTSAATATCRRHFVSFLRSA